MRRTINDGGEQKVLILIYTHVFVLGADVCAERRTAAAATALMLCVLAATAAGQAYDPGKPSLESLLKFKSLLLCYFGQVRQSFLQTRLQSVFNLYEVMSVISFTIRQLHSSGLPEKC